MILRALGLSALLTLQPAWVHAQEATPPSAPETPVPAPAAPAAPLDPGVVVEKFEFRYGLEHPELPALDQIGRVSVRLKRDDGVWRPLTDLAAGEVLTLGEIPPGSRFDGAALRQIAQDLVRWFNSQDLYGVWVAFSDLESTATGIADRRPADDHAARVTIWASQVAEVRTLARGKRFKPEFSVNNRKHRTIVVHSPLQPAAAPDQPGSLFRQGVLNKYLQGMSQHPGRLVEASIASAGSPGKVVLDYLVNETKSWQVFSQVTNFGTEATGEWRGRVGFQSNQLTNHDDILNIDGITTPDFKTYGSFLSYRIPIIRPSLLMARVYGSYGDFLANDVQITTLRFVGRNWLAGMEFTNRLSLPRDWQVVSALGANFAHYGIQQQIVPLDPEDDPVALVTASSNFLIPFASTTISRQASWWALSGSLRYEQTVGDFANLDTTNGIQALGRSNVDSQWSSLRWTLAGSIYLEPLFAGGDNETRFLANEVSFRVRGRFLKEGPNLYTQNIEGARLIPHEQEPIGGAFSVRGYPESALSADEFIVGSIEYAFHFPRVLKPGPAGKFLRDNWAFQWRPKKLRQEPDWDLIGRVFYDYARRQVAPLPLEEGQVESDRGLAEQTLNIAGAGGGLELQIKQNLSIRCDVGLSLTELFDDTREANEKVVVPAGQVHYYISTSFSW